jgi:hypothetical protein
MSEEKNKRRLVGISLVSQLCVAKRQMNQFRVSISSRINDYDVAKDHT